MQFTATQFMTGPKYIFFGLIRAKCKDFKNTTLTATTALLRYIIAYVYMEQLSLSSTKLFTKTVQKLFQKVTVENQNKKWCMARAFIIVKLSKSVIQSMKVNKKVNKSVT